MWHFGRKKCMIFIDSLPCGYPYDHICPVQVCQEQGGEEQYQYRRVRVTASNAHQVVHLKSGAAITTFLNKSLNQSNVGCHFYSICVNHLFYADDSVVIVTLLWLLNNS